MIDNFVVYGVYFDQHFGAAHSKFCLRYALETFLHENKKGTKKKKKEAKRCFLGLHPNPGLGLFFQKHSKILNVKFSCQKHE